MLLTFGGTPRSERRDLRASAAPLIGLLERLPGRLDVQVKRGAVIGVARSRASPNSWPGSTRDFSGFIRKTRDVTKSSSRSIADPGQLQVALLDLDVVPAASLKQPVAPIEVQALELLWRSPGSRNCGW